METYAVYILIRKRNAKILKPYFLEKNHFDGIFSDITYEKVQVGKDQEKAQSEKDSHSKNRGGKKPN